jgi:uncharacterized protein
MELACNYSLPLMRLLGAGTSHVDWIKLSRREVLDLEMAAAEMTRPLLLHTLCHLGTLSLLDGAPDWRGTVERLTRARSPHVAAHLAFFEADGETGASHERIRARVVANLRTLQAELPVPLLVENQPYYGTRGTHRLTVDPGFIRSVVEETGVGLLLDTAHLRVAASHLGVDPRAYLRALPLDRVREVHVAGPRVTAAEGLTDRHWELLEEDYAFLGRALELATPRILTLEYGGTGPEFETPERNDPAALEQQLTRLARVVAGAAGA